jgi:hypothetical protein
MAALTEIRVPNMEMKSIWMDRQAFISRNLCKDGTDGLKSEIKDAESSRNKLKTYKLRNK